MGPGRTERRGTLKSSDGRPLNNGSRHRDVESYNFGSQPRVEKDITREVGGPRDVKTQDQVSKTSVGRVESVTRCIERGGEGSVEEECGSRRPRKKGYVGSDGGKRR